MKLTLGVGVGLGENNTSSFNETQIWSLSIWAVSVVAGVVYSAVEFISFKRMVLDGHGKTENDKALQVMLQVSKAISEGATAFLMEEFMWLSAYILIAMAVIFISHFFLLENENVFLAISTTVAFLIGSITSAFCAFLSMKVAVMANVRLSLIHI